MPKAYHKNPRKISEKQMDALRRDLAELGDLSGIVHDLNSDEIVGGNQRSRVFDLARCEIVLTSEQETPDEQGTVGLGYVVWQGKRYAYRAVRWDAKTCEKANIVANKAGGAWDLDILTGSFEVDDLLEWGFEREELGLEDVLPSPLEDPGPQIDRAEELREKWQVESGQLWQLGEHRLICGDCTDAAVVARVMGGEKAGAIVTDPPYGTAAPGKVQKRGDEILPFDIDWDKEAPTGWIPHLFSASEDGAAVVSFWDNKQITALWNCFDSAGFHPLQTVYWQKTTVPQPRPNFCSSVESAVFARKPGKVLCWNGGGATPNILEANRAAGKERTLHETQKPLSLIVRLLELITNAGMLVCDPFLGSGTTLIACEQLSRKCRAVEISPAYVAVALERWATATGKTPELVTNG